jgi:hypothetical protein
MSATWISWASYAGLATEACLIASLVRNGLFRVYQWFFAYLSADVLETAAGLVAQTNRRLYAQIYFAGQSIKIVVAVLVVLELYKLALERHPALSHFGRMTVAYVLAVAAAVAGFGIMLDRTIAEGDSAVLHHFFTFERTMDLWMLLFLLIVVCFMSWFPIALKRNSAWYIAGFMVYFFSRSAGLLMINLSPQWKAAISDVVLVTSIVCLLVWLFALTRRGEEITTVVGHRWSPSEAKRLSGQLEAINAKLARLSRR